MMLPFLEGKGFITVLRPVFDGDVFCRVQYATIVL